MSENDDVVEDVVLLVKNMNLHPKLIETLSTKMYIILNLTLPYFCF